jgi:diacylglycerol O-acyltransferase / wax synthase
MSTTQDHLSPLDSTFLELEQGDECSSMHIGGALLFDPVPRSGGAPSLRSLQSRLNARLGEIPRYHQKLSEPRVHGLRRPTWVDDPNFDIAAHVRRATLPAPGGREELHEWLGDYWTHRLDRTRPLWEMTLLDGLPGGHWVLATKTHHAMVDGVGSVGVGEVMLDAEPSPPRRKTPSYHPPVKDAHEGRGLSPLAPAKGAARFTRATIDTVLHPERVMHAAEAAVAIGEMVWRDEINAARSSSLNIEIGATRRFTSVRLDLEEVKAIKNSLGGTVNDVVLTVATGALRALLKARGEDLERPLRAMVPVNLRGGDGTMGNKVTSLFVELPVGVADLDHRYTCVRAAADKMKTGNEALGTSTLIAVTGLAPPLLHEAISQTLYAPRLFNITITNVPGPQIPLFAHGARLREIIPLVPLFAGHALGMAIVSYDGALTFGLNADYASVPDLELFETALPGELAGLRELAGLA